MATKAPPRPPGLVTVRTFFHSAASALAHRRDADRGLFDDTRPGTSKVPKVFAVPIPPYENATIVEKIGEIWEEDFRRELRLVLNGLTPMPWTNGITKGRRRILLRLLRKANWSDLGRSWTSKANMARLLYEALGNPLPGSTMIIHRELVQRVSHVAHAEVNDLLMEKTGVKARGDGVRIVAAGCHHNVQTDMTVAIAGAFGVKCVFGDLEVPGTRHALHSGNWD